MHREGRDGEEIHVDAQEAKAGRRGSFAFRILLMSLTLLLLLYGITLLIGTASAPHNPDPAASDAAG